MSLDAAQEQNSEQNWHPSLVDCFQVFGTASERLLTAKLKVSFPLFGEIHAVPVNVGYGSSRVRRWVSLIGSLPTIHSDFGFQPGCPKADSIGCWKSLRRVVIKTYGVGHTEFGNMGQIGIDGGRSVAGAETP